MNRNIFTFSTNQSTTTQNINQPKVKNSTSIEESVITAFNEIISELEQLSSQGFNKDNEFMNAQDNELSNKDNELSNIEDELSNIEDITYINSTNNSSAKDNNSSKENKEDDTNKQNKLEYKNDIHTHNTNQAITTMDGFDTQKNLQIGVNNEDDLKYSLEHNSNIFTNKIDIEKTKDLNKSQNLDFEKSMLLEDDKESYDFDINEGEFKVMDNHDEGLVSNKNTFEEELLKASESEELSDNILKQIDSGLKTSSTPRNMNIMLKPQQLGNVNVKIKFLPTGMHIEIIVDNDVTQDAIMNNLSKLEHIISPNNDLNIASINISQRKDIQIKEQQAKEYSLELKKQENIMNSKRVNPIFYKKKH